MAPVNLFKKNNQEVAVSGDFPLISLGLRFSGHAGDWLKLSPLPHHRRDPFASPHTRGRNGLSYDNLLQKRLRGRKGQFPDKLIVSASGDGIFISYMLIKSTAGKHLLDERHR